MKTSVFELVSTAMGLINWLSDEIEIEALAHDFDHIKSVNNDIWNVANMIRSAVNGSITWEEAERNIIDIRRRYEE